MDPADQGVKSTFHDDPFYRPLVEGFVHDMADVENELQDFFEQDDWEQAAALCHRMCGSAATYGYPDLAQVFNSLEKSLRKNGCKFPDAVDGHRQILQQFAGMRQALNKK